MYEFYIIFLSTFNKYICYSFSVKIFICRNLIKIFIVYNVLKKSYAFIVFIKILSIKENSNKIRNEMKIFTTYWQCIYYF